MANDMFWTTEATTTGVVYKDSPWNITVMDIIYCLIAILGIIGNGLVLYVFFKVPQLRVTTNILIRHQSLVDFISSLLLPLTFVLPEKNLGTLNEQSPFLASFICKMWYSKYFFWTFIKISTINLVFLTLERYFAVLHSRQYRKRANTRNLVLVCAFAWLLGAAIEVYFPIIHWVHGDGDCTSSHIHPEQRKPIGYISLFTTLLIPVSVMVFVYASIIRFLRRREATLVVYREHSTFSRKELTSLSAAESSPLHRRLQPPPQSSSPLMTPSRNDDEAQDDTTTSGDVASEPLHRRPQPPSQPSSPLMTRTRNDGVQDELRLQEQQGTTISKGAVPLEPLSKSAVTLEVPTENFPSNEDNVVNIKKKKSKTSAEVASRNILITMFIVCVTYVVCWTPDILLYWHHTVVTFQDWKQPFHRFAILLSFCNVCTNPIIYTFKYRSFQNGLKTVFGRQSTVSLWISSHI